MRLFVKRFFLATFFSLVLVVSFVPAPAEAAGIVPCGRSQDDSSTNGIDESQPCTICHVVVGAGNLMQWGMNIMTVIAITVIFAMGVLYVISAGNQGLMETAKKGMWAALIGFAIMLLAWLIVNTVLTILVDKEKGLFPQLVSTPGVFNFACDTRSNVQGQ